MWYTEEEDEEGIKSYEHIHLPLMVVGLLCRQEMPKIYLLIKFCLILGLI